MSDEPKKRPGATRTREEWAEMGRKGGSTNRDRHGLAHFARIGRKGGTRTARTHGQEFFQEIGRQGGQKVAALIAAGKRALAEEELP